MPVFLETTDAPSGLPTPYQINVGDEFQGSLSGSDEVDRVLMSLQAGVTYTLNLTGLTGGSGIGRLGLIHNSIAAHHWAMNWLDGSVSGGISGVTTVFNGAYWQIPFTVPVTGYYSVFVDDNGDSSAGNYTISLTNAAPTSGDDSLFGGIGDDTVSLLGGDDFYSAAGGRDSVRGGSGNDTIYGGDRNDTLLGNNDNDSLSGDGGHDYMVGGSGNDTLIGGLGRDTLIGSAGENYLDGGAEKDWIKGGNDSITGSGGNDSLSGGDDNDTLTGGDDNDTLSGDAGADSLDGGRGDDSILGGDDNDLLKGRAGADTMLGGAGNDTLLGSIGDDSLNGGADSDLLRGEDDNDSLSGDDGADTLYGNKGNDFLDGGADDDWMNGGGGDDTMQGGIGADTLKGGDGNDLMEGGEGRDTLIGKSGNDTLIGGADKDLYVGGVGNDVFVLEAGIADHISDFQDGVDKIDITAFGRDASVSVTDDDGDAVLSVNGAVVAKLGDTQTSKITEDDFIRYSGADITFDGGTVTFVSGETYQYEENGYEFTFQALRLPTATDLEVIRDLDGDGDLEFGVPDVHAGTAWNSAGIYSLKRSDDGHFDFTGFDLVGAGGGDQDGFLSITGRNSDNGYTVTAVFSEADDDLWDLRIGTESVNGISTHYGLTQSEVLNWFRDIDNLTLRSSTIDANYDTARNASDTGDGIGIDNLFFSPATSRPNPLQASNGNDNLTGQAIAANINGQEGNDTISGGSGFNEIAGGAGADKFIIGNGFFDSITDFQIGQDRIDLTRFAPNSTWSTQDDGLGNAQILVNGSVVASLIGISHSDLTDRDFILPPSQATIRFDSGQHGTGVDGAPIYQENGFTGRLEGNYGSGANPQNPFQNLDADADLEFGITNANPERVDYARLVLTHDAQQHFDLMGFDLIDPAGGGPLGGLILTGFNYSTHYHVSASFQGDSGDTWQVNVGYNTIEPVTQHHNLTFEQMLSHFTDIEGLQIHANLGAAHNEQITGIDNIILRTDSRAPMIGDSGDNLLIGNDDDDRIDGSAGNDTLDGGGGYNILTGGSGNDIFRVGHGLSDRITDFQVGSDQLDLRSFGPGITVTTEDDGAGNTRVLVDSTLAVILDGTAVADLTGVDFALVEASNAAPTANPDNFIAAGASEISITNDRGVELATLTSGKVVAVTGNVNVTVFDPETNITGTPVRANVLGTPTAIAPKVTELADGGFAVTWYENGPGNIGLRVMGRIFDGDGQPVAAPFQVNTVPTETDISHPTVSQLQNGNLFWAFTSDGSDADPSSAGIKGLITDLSGAAVGSEFQVNSTTQSTQWQPKSTTLTNGEVVVVWSSAGNVAFRIFDETGTATTAEVDSNNSYQVDVAALETGGFVLSYRAPGTYKATIYDDNGVEIVPEFAFVQSAGTVLNPKLTVLNNGNIVFTWDSVNGPDDTSNAGIRARIFAPDGTPVTDEFPVNISTEGGQVTPDVTPLADGGFMIAWWDQNIPYAIKSRIFEADGTPAGLGKATTEDTPITFTAAELLANDTDPDGDTLSIVSVSNSIFQSAVTLNPDGSVSYNPAGVAIFDALAEGETLEDLFTYTISDGNGNTSTSTVTLSVLGVDDAPVQLSPVPHMRVYNLTDFTADLSGTFSDHDGDSDITYALAQADGSALPDFMNFNAASQTLSIPTFIPDPQQSGPHHLILTGTEASGLTSSTSFAVVVSTVSIPAADAGDNTINGSGGADWIAGQAGNDSLAGGIGNDALFGDEDNDTLNGVYNDDFLDGGSGNDSLLGGYGEDTLIGGSGADTMAGGSEADHFVFAKDSGHDEIADFELLTDRILLDGGQTVLFTLDSDTDGDGLSDSTIVFFGDASSVVLQSVTGVTNIGMLLDPDAWVTP
ncbi:MAG: cadherin-like domain-containing protein [Pelagimonas sp.]|nr:cadherin-like domain-containing protein [Pelagimonas sp.]